MSSLNRKLATLISGTALAQVATFLFAPIISRLYLPSDFGEFAVYMFLVNAVQVIACGRYEMAIVLAKNRAEALNLVALSLLVCVFFAGLSGVGTIGFYAYTHFQTALLPYSSSSPYPHLQNWLWFMPFFILLLGAYMALNQWLIRHEAYKEMSTARFSTSLATSGLQAMLGAIKVGANGIAAGTIVGHFIYSSVLYYYSQKIEKNWRTTISWVGIKQAAIQYQSLPRTTLFQSLVEMFQSNALSWLLPFFYSAVEGGFYFRTLIIFQAPVGLIGQALAQVAYREASALQANGEPLRPLVISTLKKSALVGFPICLSLICLGPWAFSTFFGEKWYEAGVYARILAVWMYIDFMRIPLAQLAIIIDKQAALLKRSLLGTAILLVSVSAGYYISHDVYLSLCLLSAGMSVFTTYLIIWLVRVTN